VQTIDSISDDAPFLFEAQFLFNSKADEFDMLDFFYSRYGKHGRFWIEHPAHLFTLESTAILGAAAIYCESNKADLMWQGYERIYVVMTNGDIWTRKVGSIDYEAGNDRIKLNLVTPLDRELTSANHQLFGRFLLVRFESDVLNVDHYSSGTCKVTVKFRELVKEYDEI
jgi:hypothetical protein